MANGSPDVYVDHDEMPIAVDKATGIAEIITDLYTDLHRTIEQVTSKEAWRGTDADTLVELFEQEAKTADVEFVQVMNKLAPTLKGADDRFTTAQEENTADIKSGVKYNV